MEAGAQKRGDRAQTLFSSGGQVRGRYAFLLQIPLVYRDVRGDQRCTICIQKA